MEGLIEMRIHCWNCFKLFDDSKTAKEHIAKTGHDVKFQGTIDDYYNKRKMV